MASDKILYQVAYRKIKYPRLEFKTGELMLVLPYGRKPEELVAKHRDWIQKKAGFIKKCLEDSAKNKLVSRSNGEFIRLANRICREIGVKFNAIYFKMMTSKWASVSSKRNITLNILMKYLPQNLVRYIIFHEAAHFKERKHNQRFWRLIAEQYPAYKDIENKLFAYWFLVCKKEGI